MIATAIVLIVIVLCAALLYLKGSLFMSLATLFSVIISNILAFAYFEQLASVFISRKTGGPSFAAYWQSISFALIFVLAFAVLQTAVSNLLKKTFTFDSLHEKIGRSVFGIIAGLFLSGALLTALGLAPVKNNIPYERFQPAAPQPASPSKALLNADGLAAGIFSAVSSGSLSGSRSFAVMHPDFLNEIYLNRIATEKDVSLVTISNVIEVPKKASAWPAPAGLKTSDDTVISSDTGKELYVVQVEIKAGAGDFTTAQLRLICGEKDAELMKGSAVVEYPVGYLLKSGKVRQTELAKKISLSSTKTYDWLFNVPAGYVPALVTFKQNNIAPVTKIVETPSGE